MVQRGAHVHGCGYETQWKHFVLVVFIMEVTGTKGFTGVYPTATLSRCRPCGQSQGYGRVRGLPTRQTQRARASCSVRGCVGSLRHRYFQRVYLAYQVFEGFHVISDHPAVRDGPGVNGHPTTD